MKKTIFNTTLILLLIVVNSCQRSFEEINTDNSRIKNPSAGSFLKPIQYEMASYGYKRADDFTFDIMQVAVPFPNEGNTVSRYYFTEGTGNGYWNTSYKWLKQVSELNAAATKEQNNNYIAISKVLNAWIFANLTDAFGDVPMSEALALENNMMKPKYDHQKDIYQFLLDDLKAANALFDVTKTLPEGDLFYQANTSTEGIVKWKKFSNSLSLRLLTRILKKNGEINVHQRINEIVNNPTTYPIFKNNEDGATLDISGVAPLLPPIARPQDFTTFRAAGEFFTQILVDNQDPRQSKFFTQAKSIPANQNMGFKGVPSGYALGSSFNYQPSNMNQNLAKAPLKILVMPYAELQFILSELAFKAIIPGDAKTFYQNGVTATIEQWGNVLPANYFDNPKVAYNGTFERIMLQKYVSLFFIDHQQWYEQRRTGFPVLPNNGGLLNDGKMPQRMLYPTTTKIQNYDNYVIASQRMGGDNINTKIWWND